MPELPATQKTSAAAAGEEGGGLSIKEIYLPKEFEGLTPNRIRTHPLTGEAYLEETTDINISSFWDTGTALLDIPGTIATLLASPIVGYSETSGIAEALGNYEGSFELPEGEEEGKKIDGEMEYIPADFAAFLYQNESIKNMKMAESLENMKMTEGLEESYEIFEDVKDTYELMEDLVEKCYEDEEFRKSLSAGGDRAYGGLEGETDPIQTFHISHDEKLEKGNDTAYA